LYTGLAPLTEAQPNVRSALWNQKGDTMDRDRSNVQAVLRACDILKAFRHTSEALPLSDIIDRTGLCKTTAFRLLQSLVKGGLVEQVGKGVYRTQVQPVDVQPIRMGFAAQTDSEFCREVSESLQRVAARERVHLITVNNRYSAREAVRNADLLIRERVDLVFEFQTYSRIAPVIASKFLDAQIPVIAIEIPHPGATFFGANNYQAGAIGGRALGRWTKEHWDGKPEQVVFLELPIAGPLPALRLTGMLDGLRAELPRIDSIPVTYLDGKGDFDQVFSVLRRYLRHHRLKRTLVGAVNDMCALAALRAIEEVGGSQLCAVMGQNAIAAARDELRRPGTRLIGSVAYFPERYGDELIPLALSILQKKPVPPASFVKHQLITPKNVDLVYPLDARVGNRSAAVRHEKAAAQFA
jgi:ribose transport system substrate-binding protein